MGFGGVIYWFVEVISGVVVIGVVKGGIVYGGLGGIREIGR